jgi:hypothetical protein
MLAPGYYSVHHLDNIVDLETFVEIAAAGAHEDQFVVVGGTVADLAALVEVSIEVAAVKALGQAGVVSVPLDSHLISLRHFAYSQVVSYTPHLDIVVEEAVVACCQSCLRKSSFAYELDSYWEK